VNDGLAEDERDNGTGWLAGWPAGSNDRYSVNLDESTTRNHSAGQIPQAVLGIISALNSSNGFDSTAEDVDLDDGIRACQPLGLGLFCIDRYRMYCTVRDTISRLSADQSPTPAAELKGTGERPPRALRDACAGTPRPSPFWAVGIEQNGWTSGERGGFASSDTD
jgi:hypothetical protein